jgi:hypothetical protein
MFRVTSAALTVLLVTLTGVVLWLGIAAHRVLAHLDGAVTRAEGIETKANATLMNLDKGTAVWADSAKDQARAVQELATDAHGTLAQANTALGSFAGVAVHAQATADAATSLLKSTQRSTDAIPDTLGHVDQVLESSRSLLQAGERTDARLNDLLAAHAIERTLDNIAGMTDQGNGILTDFRKVADKATSDWLKPVPWWKAPISKGGELIDIGAAIARHVP